MNKLFRIISLFRGLFFSFWKCISFFLLIWVIGFLVLGCQSKDQIFKKQQEDNLILIQTKMHSFYENNVLDSIPNLALEMSFIARSLNDTNIILKSFYELGKINFFLDRFNLAEWILEDGYAFTVSTSDTSLLISYERLFGNVKSELGKYSEAKSLYLKGLNLIEKSKNNRLEPILLMDLAHIESKINFNFQNIQNLFEQALAKMRVNNTLRDTAYLYANYSAIIENYDPSLALFYVNKAITSQKELGEFAPITNILKAKILFQLNEVKEAETILNLLKTKINRADYPNIEFYTGLLEAEMYFSNFQCKQGYQILESIIDLVPNENEFEEIISMLESLEGCEEFKSKNQQILIKALNLSKEQGRVLIQNEYKIAKDLQDKKAKESELVLAQQKTETINLKFNYLSIILIIVSIVFIVFYLGYVNYKREVNKKLKSYHKLMESINENEDFTLSEKIIRFQSPDLILIDSYFKQNDAYLNPQFSKEEFLQSLHIDYNKMLQLLRNKNIANNFNDLVNLYRVDRATHLMRNPAFKHFSIEGLAKEVGFGSRQSFYNAFERHMGMSPTFFRDNLKLRN